MKSTSHFWTVIQRVLGNEKPGLGLTQAISEVAVAVNPIRALPWFGIGITVVLTAKAMPYLFG